MINPPTEGTITLSNSVCWSREIGEPTHAHALWVGTEGDRQDKTVFLRNDTAVADGASGDGIYAAGVSGVNLLVDARNVIARSLHGVDVESHSDESVSSQSRVALQSSNYLTTAVLPLGALFIEVTPAGTGGNQTDDPQFVDREDGDFHLAATSPALDAGSIDAKIGSTDFDGENRSQAKCLGPEAKAIPDIGAFERRPNSSCPPKPPPPPPPVEPFKAVFRILSLKLNRHTGAGSVQIEVPGPGVAAVTGSGIKFVRRPSAGPGTVTLPIRPWVITLVRLNKRGKTKVQMKVKWEPQVGPPAVSRAACC